MTPADPAAGLVRGASPGSDPAGRRWTVAAGRYVATFGFCEPGESFAGALSCLSLTRDGVDLLVPPGAPLVVPWIGRLSAWSFEVPGGRVELAGDARVTPDECGRPLHGIAVDPGCWQVEVREASTSSWASGASIPEVTAELSFGEGFPLGQRVSVSATVDSDGLEVRTVVEAAGALDAPEPSPVPVAVGWHPYLRAPGTSPDRSGVEVLLPFDVACGLDALLPTGVEQAMAPGWVRDPVMDEHWRAAPGQRAVVRSGDLEVALTFGVGFGWAMTWVPEVGAGFVCVEPMAAPLDPYRPGAPTPVAHPGHRWVGEFRIG